MIRRRHFLSGALTLAGVTAQPAWAAQTDSNITYELETLRYQGWASGVLYPELAENLGYLAPIKLNWVGNTISGPQDIQAAVTGDVDFGAAFNGSVAKLIAAGAPAKAVIAMGGADKLYWSGLYVLEESPIRTPRDLVGKKIGVNTLGAQAEFGIDDYLSRAGLSDSEIADITLVVLPPTVTEQALREKRLDGAMLGMFFRDKAVARGGLRLMFSEYTEFGAINMDSYILRNDFIQRNPNTTRKFVEATARAIQWAQTTDRAEVVARFQDIIRQRARGESTDPVGYWKSTGIATPGGVQHDKDFSLFTDWYAKRGDTTVGRVPVSGLYTNALNPFRTEADRG